MSACSYRKGKKDDDDEDEYLMKQAVMFELDENEVIDFNTPPSNGMEYLKRVRIEAQQCEEIKVAPHLNLPKTDTFSKDIVIETKDASVDYYLSAEWQLAQEKEFIRMREKFQFSRLELVKKAEKPTFPAETDITAWYNFLYGAENNKNAHSDDKEGHLPLLSIVLFLSQCQIKNLLFYHISWIEEDEFSSKIGLWLYSLLVCLEDNLDPDTHSVLRCIARTCASIRAKMETPSEDIIGSLNLIICLIARHFKQFDLIDNPS